MPVEVQKQMIADLLNGMKHLPPEERTKLMEKMLDNPNLDPSVRAKLIEEMLKNVDDLPPEERKKLLEKMLENRDSLNPAMRAKLINEMIKNINQMSPEEREKFLTGLYRFSQQGKWRILRLYHNCASDLFSYFKSTINLCYVIVARHAPNPVQTEKPRFGRS
jgi:DNA-directed RNA polymerase subunit F